MIPRRIFIGSLGLHLLAARRHAHAQASAKAPRVGWLSRGAGPDTPWASSTGTPTFKAFAEGLRALGYVIGESVVVDVRATQHGTSEEYVDLAAKLVAVRTEVVLASTPQAREAMTKAPTPTPIAGGAPECDHDTKGWVGSVARPGGNVTGFFLDIPEMSGKQLQLLKEVTPTLQRVAVIGDRRVNEVQFRAAETAARAGGLVVQQLPIKSTEEIPGM